MQLQWNLSILQIYLHHKEQSPYWRKLQTILQSQTATFSPVPPLGKLDETTLSSTYCTDTTGWQLSCIENFVKFRRVVFETRNWTYRHTDHSTLWHNNSDWCNKGKNSILLDALWFTGLNHTLTIMGGNGMSRNTVSAFRLALVARKWPLHNHIQNWNATLTAI